MVCIYKVKWTKFYTMKQSKQEQEERKADKLLPTGFPHEAKQAAVTWTPKVLTSIRCLRVDQQNLLNLMRKPEEIRVFYDSALTSRAFLQNVKAWKI